MPVWLRHASAFILDLDGTLWRGNQLLPGAAELLHRLDGRYVLASNNSTHDAVSLSHVLAAIGLQVPPQRIVLAGETAVSLIGRRYPGASVMPLCSDILRGLALRSGLACVDSHAEVVLLARHTGFDYAALAAAANALRSGARLMVANPDLTHPGVDGSIVPETGSLLQAILAAAGDVEYEVIGKPEPALFSEALRRLGSTPADTLVIGDNLLTDAAGAVRSGMSFLLLGDGPCSDARDPLALLSLPSRGHRSVDHGGEIRTV